MLLITVFEANTVEREETSLLGRGRAAVLDTRARERVQDQGVCMCTSA